MLYSPEHEYGAGQGVERSNDFSWIDKSECRNLIAGQHVIVGTLGGRISKVLRRCGDEIADFSDCRAYGCIFRPPVEPVAKHTAIVRGQSACVYYCPVREGFVSRNEQCDPVQVFALLIESRLDFMARG
jgi:hypothetical protein